MARHEARLRAEIFDPAVKLHQAMCCSVYRYEAWLEPVRAGTPPDEGLPHDFKDIGTWRMIGSPDVHKVLGCLYPGLRRVGVGGEKLVLVKPVILALTTPQQLEQSFTTSFSPGQDESSSTSSHDTRKPNAGLGIAQRSRSTVFSHLGKLLWHRDDRGSRRGSTSIETSSPSRQDRHGYGSDSHTVSHIVPARVEQPALYRSEDRFLEHQAVLHEPLNY